MVTTETLSLIRTLKPKIGEKEAEELVTFIEETKSEHLATKADLKDVEICLRKEIKELEVSLRKEIKEVEISIREVEINLRKELNANMWKIFGGIGLLLSIFMAILKLTGN